jgi:general secretion pathway protein F
VALVMIVGLMTYVVPQVVQVFEQSRQALPFLTRALLWVTDALQGKLLILGVVACLLAVGARAAYSRPGVRLRVQGSMLRLPLLGSLIQGLETARLASTLAILVGSGVPLLQALETGAAVIGALPLRRAVDEAARRVREGSSLHRALGGQGLFPPIFIHLIASGEASGRLSHMLSQAARQQEFENEGRIRLLTGILEPGVVVVMGIAVLLVVLAVLLPIIEINQLVRR